VGRRLSISLRKYATVFMLSCPVLIKFKWMVDQRNMWVFALTARQLCPSGHQNNTSIGMTVPKGIEWHLYPEHCGSVLGSWTFWGTRKWNC
jgi:hypothetical protein